MNQHEAQLRLDALAETAEGFLDLAEGCVRRGEFDQGLQWTSMAASVLATQNRDLSSPRIESNLQFYAGLIPEADDHCSEPPVDADGRQSLLHVFTRALPHGGHTATSIRWIKLENGRKHDVALLSQDTPVPEELIQAVRESGGEIHMPDSQDSLLGRAEWLRKLAARIATHVVLHVDMFDVIPGVAFGRSGGPPVMLLNHAAHTYWAGSSVADLVLNCRGSECETYWTRTYRGIVRCATVPIPLTVPVGLAATGDAGQERRDQAKTAIGISKDTVLILTSGESYKFARFDSLDFIAVCEELLNDIPNACVVAVGPEEDGRWKAARERSGNRLRTVGRQPRDQMAVFQNAADVYIEGFPFGSTTALFESAIRGVPVVLSPAQCPPPYGTDGIALDDVIERAQTLEEYRRMVVLLAKDAGKRQRLGQRVRDSVLRHHTGEGWKQHVEAAINMLPKRHSVQPTSKIVRTPDSICEYWTRLRHQLFPGMGTVYEDWTRHAFSNGLRPQAEGLSSRKVEPSRRRGRAEFLMELAERHYAMGDTVAAAEFYRVSLECHPWNLRAQSKRVLLSLGKTGEFLRGISRLLRGRGFAMK